jgi:hypothetical protein
MRRERQVRVRNVVARRKILSGHVYAQLALHSASEKFWHQIQVDAFARPLPQKMRASLSEPVSASVLHPSRASS